MSNRFKELARNKATQPLPASPAAEAAARAAAGDDVGPERRLNVRVPEGLYDAYKEKAEAEGHTITWVVLQHMRDYVSP